MHKEETITQYRQVCLYIRMVSKYCYSFNACHHIVGSWLCICIDIMRITCQKSFNRMTHKIFKV